MKPIILLAVMLHYIAVGYKLPEDVCNRFIVATVCGGIVTAAIIAFQGRGK